LVGEPDDVVALGLDQPKVATAEVDSVFCAHSFQLIQWLAARCVDAIEVMSGQADLMLLILQNLADAVADGARSTFGQAQRAEEDVDAFLDHLVRSFCFFDRSEKVIEGGDCCFWIDQLLNQFVKGSTGSGWIVVPASGLQRLDLAHERIDHCRLCRDSRSPRREGAVNVIDH
jgi:hypothetical protein